MATRYNLPLAPKKSFASTPIDLGDFDPEFSGWFIIVDLGVSIQANDIVAVAADADAHPRDRNAAVAQWLAHNLIEWNFVDEEGVPLPQPREGGAVLCQQRLIDPVARAIASVLTPKKD